MSKSDELSIFDSIMSALSNNGITCEEDDDGIIANINGTVVHLTIKKKEYIVRFHYKSCVGIIVTAENEDKAIQAAFNQVTDKQIIDGIVQACQPDVEEVKK